MTDYLSQPQPKTHNLCVTCNQPIVNRDSSAKTCSKDCARKWRNKRARLRRPKKLNMQELEFKVFARCFFSCVYCGRSPMRHGVVLTLDHINPIDNGGKTIESNLVAACERCNRLKDNMLIHAEMAEWLAISKEKLGIGKSK